jgi:pyruvate dehydrogenase E2 component (dihydrolipoamide acetyltransferase)
MMNSRLSGPRATPRARRALRQHGLDPAAVAGTGPRRRIVEADVLRAARAPGAAGVRRPLSATRRTIARRLLLAKQTIPHFYLRQQIDAGELAAYYAQCRKEFGGSLNDLVIRAAALAVAEFPAFRSRLEGDDLLEMPQANIGMAVGLDDGLVVPVVLQADRLGLPALAAETRRLAESARARKIENAGQGVFTVSNLGMFGTEEFTAIVNPPEAAILAVGALREQALVRGGILAPGQAMTLTLSCDHRIIDGVCAARFVRRLQELLEAPRTHLAGPSFP